MIFLYCYCAVSLILFVFYIPALFRSNYPLGIKLGILSLVFFWLPIMFVAACIGISIWIRRGINNSFKSFKTSLKDWWNEYE